MDAKAKLQEFIEALHHDVPKKWLERFNFKEIVTYTNQENSYHVPCIMEEHRYKRHPSLDIIDTNYFYPSWCDVDSLTAFEKEFIKDDLPNKKQVRNEYKIKYYHEPMSIDSWECTFEVERNGVTIEFNWEQD